MLWDMHVWLVAFAGVNAQQLSDQSNISLIPITFSAKVGFFSTTANVLDQCLDLHQGKDVANLLSASEASRSSIHRLSRGVVCHEYLGCSSVLG